MLFSVLSWTSAANEARGQSLVEMYRAARFKEQSERLLNGYRPHALPPEHVYHPTDSLRDWLDRVFPPEPEPPDDSQRVLQITRWRTIPKLGRSWFAKEFGESRWTYVGSNDVTPLDTTFTRELRARLQAEFGSPTQTIADYNPTQNQQPGEYVQFEYWFVLNDSIPLMVMDVNGPFERGLVVASDHAYAALLPEIKEVFLGRIVNSTERAPYADYYFLPEERIWFLSGYDGSKFFIERIRRPDLKLGRPLLRERD